MTQKFVHKVSPDLTDDAQYGSYSEVPTAALNAGTTLLMYPGSYDPFTISSITGDVALVGQGDRDDVVLNAVTIANTVTGTVTFENVSLLGSNDIVGSADAWSVLAIENDNLSSLIFRRCKFANTDYSVAHNGIGGNVTFQTVDAENADKGIRSNGTVTVDYSIFGPNTYCAGGGSPALVTVFNSSGAANTGTTTETVRTAIS